MTYVDLRGISRFIFSKAMKKEASNKKEEMKKKEVFHFKVFRFNLKLLFSLSTLYNSYFLRLKF